MKESLKFRPSVSQSRPTLQMIRRIIDITASLSGLIILSPLLLLVATIIKLTSPGPVFFRQTRVGQHGIDFKMYKFRSMTVAPDTECGSFEPGQCMRVTPIGKILRRTKIDELPQLWNVLTGDMSLVGPRPEVRCWVERYPERWKIVHNVKPGITDPASIQYRNEEQILACCNCPEKIYSDVILPRKLDIYETYAKSRTFFTDFGILGKTILALFKSSEHLDRTSKTRQHGKTA